VPRAEFFGGPSFQGRDEAKAVASVESKPLREWTPQGDNVRSASLHKMRGGYRKGSISDSTQSFMLIVSRSQTIALDAE
jgi:hypothetical protein